MAKRTTAALLVVVLAIFASFTAIPASAQAIYGSIIGTVTDPQGAAVPGAKVTVTNVRKGTKDEVTTNADGNYNVTHLIPDLYSVRVEAPNFKAAESTNVSLR